MNWNREKIIEEANRGRFRILEIGCGHNPSPDADLLVDKLEKNDERGGNLVTDRPVIIADAEDLSFFENKIFEKVIARHVLEHAIDPSRMLSEMERIGKSGYIETPSEFNERVNSKKEYHRWLFNLIDDKLILKPKYDDDYFGLGYLVDYLYKTNSDFRRFYMGCDKLWFVKYHWTGKINYEIQGHSPKMGINLTDTATLSCICKVSAKNRLKGFINPNYYVGLKAIYRNIVKLGLLKRILERGYRAL